MQAHAIAQVIAGIFVVAVSPNERSGKQCQVRLGIYIHLGVRNRGSECVAAQKAMPGAIILCHQDMGIGLQFGEGVDTIVVAE